jgi:hypothetical protein
LPLIAAAVILALFTVLHPRWHRANESTEIEH